MANRAFSLVAGREILDFLEQSLGRPVNPNEVSTEIQLTPLHYLPASTVIAFDSRAGFLDMVITTDILTMNGNRRKGTTNGIGKG